MTSEVGNPDLPPPLRRIVDLFAGAPKDLRLEALLEYSRRVPALPDGLDASAMEQVTECQTPFFLAVDVDEAGIVTTHFDCPPEAPTTRGFAGILSVGLDGASVDQVLAVPDDFYLHMGLAEAISGLRLRGMGAILARLKRQVRERAVAA